MSEEHLTTEGNVTRQAAEMDLYVIGDDRVLKNVVKHHPEVEPSAFRIPRELVITHALMMAAADEYLRPAGLSWSKLIILLFLRAMQDEGERGLTPSLLSDHLAVARNTVSTLIGGLERQGYITRELDAEDKRRFVIRLTTKGYEETQKASTPLLGHLQHLLNPLDETQRQDLMNGLMLLQKILLQDRPELSNRLNTYSLEREVE